MVKIVAIVTSIFSAAKFYEGQLKELFGEIIDVKLFHSKIIQLVK